MWRITHLYKAYLYCFFQLWPVNIYNKVGTQAEFLCIMYYMLIVTVIVFVQAASLCNKTYAGGETGRLSRTATTCSTGVTKGNWLGSGYRWSPFKHHKEWLVWLDYPKVADRLLWLPSSKHWHIVTIFVSPSISSLSYVSLHSRVSSKNPSLSS